MNIEVAVGQLSPEQIESLKRSGTFFISQNEKAARGRLFGDARADLQISSAILPAKLREHFLGMLVGWAAGVHISLIALPELSPAGVFCELLRESIAKLSSTFFFLHFVELVLHTAKNQYRLAIGGVFQLCHLKPVATRSNLDM